MKLLTRAALIVFVLDQASKYLVVHFLNLRELGEIDVAAPYLTFRMAWNKGINFGLLSDNGDLMRWILIAVALLISIWVIIWVARESMGSVAQIAAGLLVGGAMGNVVDRIIYGAVADFLNMSCCSIENPFAFNIADVGVFVGATGLIIFSGQKKTT